MALIVGLLFSRTGLIFMVLMGAFFWHQHDKAAAIDAYVIKAAAERSAAMAKFSTGSDAKNAALTAQLEAERGNIKTETKTIVREVNRYVTPLADARCVVPSGFVRHADAAWGLSPVPDGPDGLIDQPSGVSLSRVESVTASNAGAAREWRAEALGWRRWYTENKARYDAFNRSVAGKSK